MKEEGEGGGEMCYLLEVGLQLPFPPVCLPKGGRQGCQLSTQLHKELHAGGGRWGGVALLFTMYCCMGTKVPCGIEPDFCERETGGGRMTLTLCTCICLSTFKAEDNEWLFEQKEVEDVLSES